MQIVVMNHRSDEDIVGRSKQLSVATRVIKASRRAALINTLLVLFAVACSTAATLTVILTRPIHTKQSSADKAVLVDKDENTLATAGLDDVVSLLELPLLDMSLAELDKVSWASGAAAHSFRVLGYSRYTFSDVDLYLEGNMVLHLVSGEDVVLTAVSNPAETLRRVVRGARWMRGQVS